MYPNLDSYCLALTMCREKSGKPYSALLQNNSARYVGFIDGIIFLVGDNSFITFIDVNIQVKIVPGRITRKTALIDILKAFDLPTGDTYAAIFITLF